MTEPQSNFLAFREIMIAIGGFLAGYSCHDAVSRLKGDEVAVAAKTALEQKLYQCDPTAHKIFPQQCLTQANESATVVSCGVLDTLLIDKSFRTSPLVAEYRTAVSQQVYRVTPKGGISYHLGIDTLWANALQEAGFKTGQEGRPCIFQKE